MAFAVILLVAMGPSVAAVRGLSAVHRAAVEVRAGWLPAARLLGQAGRSFARLRVADDTGGIADPSILMRSRESAISSLDALRQSLHSYELLPLPAVERRAAVERAAILEAYMDVRAKVASLATAGDRAAAAELWFGEANQLFQSYNYRLDVSITRMAGLADAATERGEDIYRASLWLLLDGAVAAVAAAVGTGLALVTLVASPITRMARRLSRLAAGELEPDTGETLEETAGADEVSALGRALTVFRQSAARAVRREAELKRANARFDAALGNMSQGLCMYDGDGQLVVVNARYCEIFGLPPEEVRLGSTLHEAIQLRCAYGHHGDDAASAIHKKAAVVMASKEAGSWTVKASENLLVEISYRQMGDGGWVLTYDDITQRRRAEERAVFLARHDALTGLPNRALFQERVEQELAQLGRGGVGRNGAGRGGGCAVLYLDLDRFKQVNDTLGHPAGDLLLRAVADRLRALVREVDMVARLGGDEFAVVQVGLERPEDAGKLARRIVDALAAPFALEAHEVSVGASVGIALAPMDAAHFEKLLKCADMALYRAKLGGRGSFHFFEQEMDTQQRVPRELRQDLRRALACEEFELFYRPFDRPAQDSVADAASSCL